MELYEVGCKTQDIKGWGFNLIRLTFKEAPAQVECECGRSAAWFWGNTWG